MKPVHSICLAWGVAALLVLGMPAYAESLVTDFANLFDRCRISIERSSELDTAGFVPIPVPESAKEYWGAFATMNGWQDPDSDLYVVETAWTDGGGQTRHGCDIRIEDDHPALTPVEQGLLIRHFLLRQTQLIGERTHQLERALSPIPRLINLGFLLTDPSPNGCIVISSITISPDGTVFVAGSGEQAVKPCQPH